jgi:glycosyltransferase involved in cell wall biosynthesis
MARVTIVTPTYNAAPYVRQCVQSVLAQTFTDWEMVVADDGSSDGTPDLVESFRDPRVRCLRLPHRGLRSLADTYNAALAASTGELIAVLEGDDCWPSDKLAVQVAGFADPAVQLSWGAGWDVDSHGRFLKLSRTAATDGSTTRIENPSLFRELLGDDVLVPAISVMARRAALQRIGGFRQDGTNHYVDLPTWLHLLAANPGVTLYHAHVLGHWRRHSAQVTNLHHDRVLRERWRVVREVTSALDDVARARVGWNAGLERLNRLRWTLSCGRAALRAGRFARARRLHLAVLRSAPRIALRIKALKGLVSALVGVDLSAAWRRVRKRGR